MTISAKCNMYEVNAMAVVEAYAECVKAEGAESLLVVSERPLTAQAAAALESTASSLGWGGRACAFATLHPAPSSDAAGGGGARAADDANPLLGASDLLSIVEGIDPQALVATDERAAALLGSAYHRPVQTEAVMRQNGRTVVDFRDFTGMLDSDSGKQRAWALLKRLPKNE